MTEENDNDLEKLFLQSPRENFRAVYVRYSGSLFRFLYRFTVNNQVSEEILHDIFMELLGGRFKALEHGSLKSWLFTVAKNRGLNHQKKCSRLVESDMSTLPSSDNLEEQAVNRSLLQHLEKAETTLPEEIRETWNLRKLGLDNQEIASKLSIPLGTVKSRFSRLTDYLRKEFDHEA
jgi:RNA polymerase sigma factor (sigma-70 family)